MDSETPSPSLPATQPTQQPEPTPQSEPTEIPDEQQDNEFPFDKKKFDAGVEADEESDPKKYIEQLSGKLGQTLRNYSQNNGVDLELEKFAINSVISATHTSEMDQEDQSDIIKKIKNAGENDGVDDGVNDETNNQDIDFNQDDASVEMDEVYLNEMSLNDHNTKAILYLFDSSDQDIKNAISNVVMGKQTTNRDEFVRYMQEEVDYNEISRIINTLNEMGIELPEVSNENFMLDNPPKNSLFQEEAPCWKGYKQIGMKEKNGKQVPNCVKIDENIAKDNSFSILIQKKLKESFMKDEKPIVEPKPLVKPEVKPEPTRRVKPFLPKITPNVTPQPKGSN